MEQSNTKLYGSNCHTCGPVFVLLHKGPVFVVFLNIKTIQLQCFIGSVGSPGIPSPSISLAVKALLYLPYTLKFTIPSGSIHVL